MFNVKMVVDSGGGRAQRHECTPAGRVRRTGPFGGRKRRFLKTDACEDSASAGRGGDTAGAVVVMGTSGTRGANPNGGRLVQRGPAGPAAGGAWGWLGPLGEGWVGERGLVRSGAWGAGRR